MTLPQDQRAYNARLIEEFRADRGAGMGDRPLLLLTTVGRRTGQPRTTPLMYVPDGDRYLVIASNAGAPADPQWYRNVLAHDAVTVEVRGAEFAARATPLTGDDHEHQWARIKELYPFFADHEATAGRRIPVVALTRAG